ncbi:MAG: deoxyguanosinetriphosphate triphosphohydrolase, partial [Clostridiales bacterium]|nr:deoxyguanosinetriphosphate triphosphohydrolase [Clostridiales bacterium]
HDIDDAIRAHVMQEEDIPAELRKTLGFPTRERLNTLIHDIIINSQHQNAIRMSEEVEAALSELRKFMFAHVYTNPVAKGEEQRAEDLLERLFEYYMEHPEEISQTNYRMLEQGEPKDRIICDYIAGMSDQFAVAKFNEIFVPKQWQVY